jgi:hypothetical protein
MRRTPRASTPVISTAPCAEVFEHSIDESGVATVREGTRSAYHWLVRRDQRQIRAPTEGCQSLQRVVRCSVPIHGRLTAHLPTGRVSYEFEPHRRTESLLECRHQARGRCRPAYALDRKAHQLGEAVPCSGPRPADAFDIVHRCRSANARFYRGHAAELIAQAILPIRQRFRLSIHRSQRDVLSRVGDSKSRLLKTNFMA